VRSQIFYRILRHPIVLPIYPASVLILLYQNVFIKQEAIFTHDTIHWYANFNYFMLCLTRGILPLWDPYSWSGAPFYLNHNAVGTLDPTVLTMIPLIKYWNVSVLDIYHIHFLLRLLVFYIGAYALFRYISRNDWAALIGSTIVLFVMAPNSFWQHGSMLIVTYAPLIILFLLNLISPSTSSKSKGLFFIASCYLFGLSFNMYLPSYIIIYLSLMFIYLFVNRTLNIYKLRKITRVIGISNILAGILIFLIMAGPFIYSTVKLMSKVDENFAYGRYARLGEPPTSDTLIHTAELSLTEDSYRDRSTFHNLLAILFPGPDIRFFIESALARENFLFFGLIPIILVFLFFKRAQSPNKGLFLFLIIAIGLYMFSPPSWYNKILQYYPTARTITQLHNFLGFFILSWGALIAICFSTVLDMITHKSRTERVSLIWLAILAIAQILVIFLYFSFVHTELIERSLSNNFLIWIQESIVAHGWLLIISYFIVALFLLHKSSLFRFFLIVVMVGLTFYQLVEFNINLQRYVIQPGEIARTGYIHYDREFSYKPIRIPFVSRHTTFWGFLPSLYRIPAAIPAYFNDYFVVGRRSYDFIRFVSAERQKIVSGIGARRFGFFDKFTVAKDSIHALSLMSRMPTDMLHETLVLEDDIAKVFPQARAIERVDVDTIPISADVERGSSQYLADFYDRMERIDYKTPNTRKVKGYLEIDIPQQHPILDWPWDIKHIGYFQIMFGPFQSVSSYNPMRYYPNPGIRTNVGRDYICYIDFQEWLVKHAMPGFYEPIYNKYPYQCDLQKVDKDLIVSPELQGAFVTDDIGGPEKDNIIPGFTVVSLDPARVSPNRSPYGRDEPTEVIAFGPNMISFRVQNSKPGLFYYADSYSKDWKATVSGSPTYIFKANFNYKAVFVPAGNHTITFSFNPKLYILLFKIFIVVSILLMPVPIVALLYSKERK